MLYFIITILALVIVYLFSWHPKRAKHYYNNKTLWFAHRGALLSEPENTQTSFKKAIHAGFPAIEVDVISTQDNIVCCSHNFDLERQTDGQGYLHEKHYNDVKELNVFCSFNNKKAQLTTLDQVLDLIPETTRINIEIKTSKWMDFKTARLTAKILKDRKLESRAMISTFNPLTLCFIKTFFSSILTGYIVEKRLKLPFIYIAKPDFLHPISNLITDSLLRFTKRKGLRVNVWTVNTKPAIDWLVQKEVDGIITDRLEFYGNSEVLSG